MQPHFSAARVLLRFALVLTPTALSAATPDNPAARTATDLVQAALATELDGPSEQRALLLEQALERDPNCAPARWQSGFVRYDNQWLTLDEVARRVAGDATLVEYRKRRDALIDRADDHRALAQWCHKHRLADLERIHWAKVLEFNANDTEALAALQLQLYEGRLLTQSQVEAAKKKAGELRQAMKRWQPQMVKWRKAIGAAYGQKCTEALDALESLNDPEAIPAMEATFAENVASKKNDEMNLLLIETFGRISGPEATEALLRRAIVPDSQKVREAACDQLKKRPLFAFVPQLISLVPEPIEAEPRYEIYYLPSSTPLRESTVVYRTPSSIRRIVIDTVVFHRWTGNTSDKPYSEETKIRGRDQLERQVRQEMEIARRLRVQAILRLREALVRTTGLKFGDNPEEWHTIWDNTTESYRFDVPRAPSWQDEYWLNMQVGLSCFPAGTPVLTMTGTLPIERIKVGDRVLAQNPATGELAYKSVQGVTLRPAAPLMQIHTGSQTVSATRGHPFWVNGEGWLMAKQLKVGQVLHGLNGALLIDTIEELPAREAYNLVVSDFDTYFVGENHLLVHDNLPLAETSARVPGLNTEAVAP